MTDFVFDTEMPQPKRRKYTQNSHTPSQPDQSQAKIYRPLDKAKRKIRICDLSPAPEVSSPLQCSLRIVPIDEAGSFVTLSYVWGTDPATETISVDGIVYTIRPNLAAGLRQFRAQRQCPHHKGRYQSRPLSIWADAICIDQGNDEKRNHQVNLMRLVFTRCEYVFAWLGDADEDSDLAMDSIHKIKSLSRKSYFPHFLQHLTQESPFYEAAPWNVIYRLLQREFWYRVWIFQELLLPKNLIVGCGSKSLPWSIFGLLEEVRGSDDALERDGFLIRESITHIDSEVQDKIVAVCRIIQSALVNILLLRGRETSWRPGCGMTETLHFSRHLQATDPRDKIKAFWPLLKIIGYNLITLRLPNKFIQKFLNLY